MTPEMTQEITQTNNQTDNQADNKESKADGNRGSTGGSNGGSNSGTFYDEATGRVRLSVLLQGGMRVREHYRPRAGEAFLEGLYVADPMSVIIRDGAPVPAEDISANPKTANPKTANRETDDDGG